MEIEIFTLCDFAQDNNSKLTVVGTFDAIYSKQFPFVQQSFSVACRLRFSEKEVGDACSVGVGEPEWIRLFRVETIPRPSQPQLKAACDAIDFLTPATRGLTLGYGIFIRSDCWGDRLLVVHELAHVAQYERFGGILPFLRSYLFECLTVGYSAAPLEQEAIAIAARVCASSGS